LGKIAFELGDEQMLKTKLVATKDFMNNGEQVFFFMLGQEKY